jgi:hypothetical protein
MNATAASGPFRWLLLYLRHRETASARLAWLAMSRQFSMLDFAGAKDATAMTALREDAARYCPSVWEQEYLDGEVLLGSRSVNEDPRIQSVAAVPIGALRDVKSLQRDASVLLFLDDTAPNADAFDSAWRIFWAAANLFQFVRHCCVVSRKGLGGVVYDDLLMPAHPPSAAAEAAVADTAWAEVVELTAYPEEAGLLAEKGCPAPEVGIDWQDSDGAIIGEVEWLWRNQRVAFIDAAAEDELVNKMRADGWRLVTAVSPMELQKLAEYLTEETPSD